MLRWTSRIGTVLRPLRSIRTPGSRVKSTATTASTKQPWSQWARRSFPPRLDHPPYSLLTRSLIYGASIVLYGHTFMGYVYNFSGTEGISMLPTLASFGDCVFISKWYRRGRGLEVGDIVSFKHPVRLGEHAIKRVIGMQGDFVLMNTPGKSDTMIQVPQGHCWVVGDNMEHSRDSRMFGPLPLALIVGKVTAKVEWQSWIPCYFRLEPGLEPASIMDDEHVD